MVQRRAESAQTLPRACVVCLGQRGQRGTVAGQRRNALAFAGHRPCDITHGRRRCAAKHPLHALVAGHAAAGSGSGKQRLHHLKDAAGALGRAIGAAQRAGNADVVRRHAQRGLHIKPAQPRKILVIRAEIGVGEAGQRLLLTRRQQAFVVGNGPVGRAEDQDRLRRAGAGRVCGLGVHRVAGLWQRLDHRRGQRFRQHLAELAQGQLRLAHQRVELIQRAEDAVPDLSLLARGLSQTGLGQTVHPRLRLLMRVDVGQKAEQRSQLLVQRSRAAQAVAQPDDRLGQTRAHRLQRIDLGFIATAQRRQKPAAAQAIAHRVVGQPVGLVVGDRHQARAHQRQHVLGGTALFHHPQRRQQAFRGGMAGGAAAGRQKQRHAVGGEGRPQRRGVALHVLAQNQHVVPPPAPLAHQSPGQRRRKHAFLQRIAQQRQLHRARRARRGLDRIGEQLPLQRRQIASALRRVHQHAPALLLGLLTAQQRGHVQRFSLRESLGGHKTRFLQIDSLHGGAIAAGGGNQSLHGALHGQKRVEVPCVGIVLQRQEDVRVFTDCGHGGDQLVQRGRHHVKSKEPYVAFLQKRRVPNPVDGGEEFALAVLIAALQQRFVGLQYIGQIVELHPRRAGLFGGAFPQRIGGDAGLPDALQLLGSALGKAAAMLRAAVDGQMLRCGADGGAHQHDPAAVIDALAVGQTGRVEDPAAQALGAEHLKRERAAQLKRLQQRPLGLQGQLLGHHDQPRRRAGRAQRLRQR